MTLHRYALSFFSEAASGCSGAPSPVTRMQMENKSVSAGWWLPVIYWTQRSVTYAQTVLMRGCLNESSTRRSSSHRALTFWESKQSSLKQHWLFVHCFDDPHKSFIRNNPILTSGPLITINRNIECMQKQVPYNNFICLHLPSLTGNSSVNIVI